jgi:hypothetical protein
MEEPLNTGFRPRRMPIRVALLMAAALMLAACNGSSSTPTAAPRLVGAHRVALVVPATWKTDVEQGGTCPPTSPETVQSFAPLQGGVGSCSVPVGASWPAQDSVSIYTSMSGIQNPHGAPSGSVHGFAYYISDSRQSGPGVARYLVVPQARVAFLVGAATRQGADSLLATIRFAPAGSLSVGSPGPLAGPNQ